MARLDLYALTAVGREPRTEQGASVLKGTA